MACLNRLKTQAIYVLTLMAYLVATFLFFKPMENSEPPPFAHFDKLAHFIVFAGLAFLSVLSLAKKQIRYFIPVLLFLALYGGLIEVLQGTFFQRQMSFADWVADISGCLFILVLFRSTPLKHLHFWAAAH
ncbi:VanZ family protein [Gayadomonas joobiniege]|uniref:VanZ family protein n=1 Tax=Gayadomonas joobiniege TaxID=1234606 RepID=UPI00037F3C57|nr:VanZ family protein [Gayadomonas joobiniege]